MNKLIENSLVRLQSSEFILDKEIAPTRLEVRNAVLLFTNFAGVANRFGNTSKNFNIVISDFLLDIFVAEAKRKGLNVHIHQYGGKEEDEPVLNYINVKVNMDPEKVLYPPTVTLYTNKQGGGRSHTTLTNETVGCLDRADIERADCIINIKESKARPGWAVFYLSKLNVIQNIIPEFGGAYEDWDDPADDPTPDLEEQSGN